MMRVAAIAAVLVLVGCPGGRAHEVLDHRPPPGDAGSATVKKTVDAAGGTFVRGPEVTPTEPLLSWLGAQVRAGKPALVRLPIVLARGPLGFSKVGARVGGGAEALVVYPEDSKLGIGLADRARTVCKDAATCALWLEGYWLGEQDGDLTFDVIRVGDPISAEALAGALHAEVEGDSGN